jgi:hypothetical protein
MTKVERTAHALSRLGDHHPAALNGVRPIPGAWEDEEHRLISLLEECLRRCRWDLLTAAYDLHLEAIFLKERGAKGARARIYADLEIRCRALHRALDDMQ